MPIAGTIAIIAVFAVMIIGFAIDYTRHEGRDPARRARAQRYCTKHVIRKGVMGGPERLVWVYGAHRTPGNQCDGPEHRSASPYW
jgi:hypothetical protein